MKKKIYTVDSIRDCNRLAKKLQPFSIMLDFENILPHQFECNEFLENILAGINTHSIGERAFSNCVNLERVDGAINIIGERAFSFCSRMTSFNFASVQSLSEGAFEFAGLRSIDLPDNIQCIPKDCFYANNKLIKLDLNKVEELQTNAFGACGLSVISLPKTLTKLGENSFGGCMFLTDIICESEKPPKITSSTFYGCGIKNIWFFSEEVMNRYKSAPHWKKYAEHFKITNAYALSKRIEEIGVLVKARMSL